MTEEERIREARNKKVDKYLEEELDGAGEPRSPWGSLIYSIRGASESADRLSRRVVYLNWTLVILGALGLVVSGYGVFCK